MLAHPASACRHAGRTIGLRQLVGALTIALVAATLGYAFHHLTPLAGHPVASVTVLLLLAAAIGLSMGLPALARINQQLPTVVVAQPGEVQPEPLRQDHLAFCSALHSQALDHGFFVALGTRFLQKYYATFRDSPHAIGLIASVGGQPVGFLVGAVEARAHARWVVRHRGATLALYAAAGLIWRPAAALRFLRTRLRRYAGTWRRHRGKDGAMRPGSAGEAAVLSHVAVVPGARRLGAGRLLAREFEASARSSGASRAFLITLAGEDGAGKFYAALGWSQTTRLSTVDGRSVEEWTRDLEDGGGR
jgi:ribosomal protein S18 acetylase RimI-like enzyme